MIKPHLDKNARLDPYGLPDWYVVLEKGFESREQMRKEFINQDEIEDVLKDLAPKVQYDSGYSASDVFDAKVHAVKINMTHEDYQVFYNTKETVKRILRVIDSFDPITGRGLNPDGSRDPCVLTQDE